MHEEASTVVLENFAHCVSHWNLFHCFTARIVRRMGIVVFVNGTTDIRCCEKWHQRQRTPFGRWGKLLLCFLNQWPFTIGHLTHYFIWKLCFALVAFHETRIKWKISCKKKKKKNQRKNKWTKLKAVKNMKNNQFVTVTNGSFQIAWHFRAVVLQLFPIWICINWHQWEA